MSYPNNNDRRRSGETVPLVLDPNHIHVVPSVRLQDMAVGNICWLTEKRQVGEEMILCLTNHVCDEVYLRDDAYRHPIVIIGMRQRPGSQILGDILAQFLVISSYRNEKVQEYIKLKTKIRKFVFLLPIRQAPERPEHNIVREAFPKLGKEPVKIDSSDSMLARCTFQLDLDSESQLLHLQSFVDPEHVWEIPVNLIKPYRFGGRYKAAYSFRLSEDSYNVLAVKAGIEPQQYPKLWRVKMTDAYTMARQYLGEAWSIHPPMWPLPIVGPSVSTQYMGTFQHGSSAWQPINISPQPRSQSTVQYHGRVGSQPGQNRPLNLGQQRRLNPEASKFTPGSAFVVPPSQSTPTQFMSQRGNGRHSYIQAPSLPRISPSYQTSIASQEPVIPITPFLLRNNIGRVRAFVYKPGEQPIEVKLPVVEDDWYTPKICVSSEDGLPEASVPNEFVEDDDWDEESKDEEKHMN